MKQSDKYCRVQAVVPGCLLPPDGSLQKDHDGMAVALLMAEYARRRLWIRK